VKVSKLILNPEYGLYERQGKPFCSSRQVAETFEKRHDNVLRGIQKLDCSDKFRLLNFEESYYLNEQHKKQPESLMTKDGFTFLVMGYTGKKAAAFKESYIERFNLMESFINSLHAAKLEHPAFTEAVMLAHEEPKNYHFSNETDMINRIVLGMSAKQFKEAHGLRDDIPSIRPYLATDEIHVIETLQRADIGMLAILPEFEKRKSSLTELYERTRTRRLALTA
jgi:Rha family phage regulatory protein